MLGENHLPFSWNDQSIEVDITSFQKLEEVQIFEKIVKRSGFKKQVSGLKFPAFFQIFIGIEGEIDLYRNRLFAFREKAEAFKNLFLMVESGFDKRINVGDLKPLADAWVPYERAGNMNPPIAKMTMLQSKVVKGFLNIHQEKHFYKSVQKVCEFYYQSTGSKAQVYEIKNITFHLAYWSNLYLMPLLKHFDYLGMNPKCFYYGSPAKREWYFLQLLIFMGVDVVVVDTQKIKSLEQVDPEGHFFKTKEFSRLVERETFPIEKTHEALQTNTHQASEELQDILHTEDSGLYKPWQFKDYQVEVRHLKSIYEEIFIYSKEKAMYREGWQISQGKITLPNFFVKVKGVHEDLNKYFKEIHTLSELKDCFLIQQLPYFSKTFALDKNVYYQVLDSKGIIDPQVLLQNPHWPYGYLPKFVQNRLAEIIQKLVSLKGIKRNKIDPPEIQKLKTFTLLMNLKKEIVQLFQVFDYPNDIPKLVVYNNEDNGELTYEDSILLVCCAQFGLDVIIYNPAGHNDVELYIDEKYIEEHRLAKVEFHLPLKKRSLFRVFFKD